MVSRDTRVHLVVLLLSIVGYQIALVAVTLANVEPRAILAIAFAVLVYAGAHACLLWRGHDGMVPVASRLRFVATVLVLAAVAIVHGTVETQETAFGVSIGSMLLGVGLVALLLYWVMEARSGYEEATP